jgi:hypothetical protein
MPWMVECTIGPNATGLRTKTFSTNVQDTVRAGLAEDKFHLEVGYSPGW